MKNFLLIDDHEIVRAGVRTVLIELFKPCTISEASDEKSALEVLKNQHYDIVIMDVQMPATDAFGLLEYIKIKYPETKVLIFSMSPENVYASRFLQTGAMGFISKSAGLSELKKAVDLVLNDRKYISTDLAQQLAEGLIDNQNVNPFNKLSPKEFEICILLISGKTLTEIAGILNISTSTVGTHKAHLFEKLSVSNLPELIRLGKEYDIQ